MSTLLDKGARRAATGPAPMLGLPQVNLLPPEVRAARGLRKTKRWLVISLILVVAICVGVFGFSMVSAGLAATELATAQAETLDLQQEQTKYAEVPQVLGALDNTKAAVKLGMSTEIQWKAYGDAIGAVLPPATSIDTLVITAATPAIPANPPADPLQGVNVGQIVFSARSATVLDTAALIDALNGVPGFADAWVSSSSLSEDEHGVYYSTSATVQLTDAAFSHRFDAIDSEG
ncbi:PilN domain-containing protein [Cellulomonas sp.]|uniref:PilN domain-containing protein n=1 Tax=Cellulomonas sp. TaxID=40001 RepID=UPI003BAB394B